MKYRNNCLYKLSVQSLIFVCLLYSCQVLAFGIAISPTTVEMVVKPGTQNRQTITVQNVHKDKTLALTVGVADWQLSDTGKLELLPPGSFEQSAADWVRFSPAFFSLKPGEVRQVQVDMSVPVILDEAGERKLGILISTLLPSNDKRPEKSGVWNRYQVASLFYLAVPGADEELPVIRSVMLQDMASLEPVVEFTAENPGDYHSRLKGHLILKSKDGERVLKLPVEGVLTAKQTRRFKIPVKLSDKNLPAGEYSVELDVEDSFRLDENGARQAVLIQSKMPYITVANPMVSLK